MESTPKTDVDEEYKTLYLEFPNEEKPACDGSSSQPRSQQTKITIADEEIEEIILSTLENAKKDCEQLGISVIENSWNTLILFKSVSTTEIDEELEDGHMHVLVESVVSDQIDSLVAYENNSRIEEIKDKPDGGISENDASMDKTYPFAPIPKACVGLKRDDTDNLAKATPFSKEQFV
ncbi:hypothetical protein ILUMI_07783 [Ignelater luminosus]|uniref:Uncharacterized protein n=1 Tax=Ignelater luminosus TaxID=2038154 RepID=A0A8K0GB96_IGNLU|nr:hypothetical protein ILUMI_07783 [Ignelater luminosus]